MQFRLSTLFLLFVVLWSSLAVFGILGIIVFIAIVGIMIAARRGDVWKWYLAGLVCFTLLALCLWQGLPNVRDAARRAICTNNVKTIAWAIHDYQTKNGALPPPYIADKNGKPMHSWRMLLLPFMGCDSLYKQYDFGEPWDGPNNRRLLAQRPEVYACPRNEDSHGVNANCTSYVAVVGAHAAWQPGDATGSSNPELKERARDTLLLIENNCGIAWTEPRDLTLDDLTSASIVRGHGRDNGFFHCPTPCVSVARVDGSTRSISLSSLDADTLKRLLVIGGFTDDAIDNCGASPWDTPPIDWNHCLTFAAGLIVWLASSGWLLVRAARSRKRAALLASAGVS